MIRYYFIINIIIIMKTDNALGNPRTCFYLFKPIITWNRQNSQFSKFLN